MTIYPVLAYNESSIPGTSLSERLELANRENLALEVANKGNFEFKLYYNCNISALQAYAMHDFHPIHSDRDRRQEAFRHLKETLELAAILNVPRIVTVCGFGYDLVDSPFERCLEFFASLAIAAKALGVRIMIEPLSPKRAGALTHPDDIARMVEILDEPSVFSIMLDTGHLLDSGIELDSFFQSWNRPIEELQLKGSLSAPPPTSMPLKTWLECLPQLPAVICVEHRQPISLDNFAEVVKALRQLVK